MRYTGLIEKYRDRLPVSESTRIISLGEGNTPLIKLENIPKELGKEVDLYVKYEGLNPCLLYTSPSPRDQRGSRMPSSA